MKFGVDWPRGLRENDINIHVYSPGSGADNPLGSISSAFTHLFSQFSSLLQVFPNK